MPKELIELSVDEVSAVDFGANRRTWLLIKRADSDDTEVEKKALTVQQVLDHDEALEHACEDKYEIINAYMRSMQSILESDTDASEQETLAVQSTREFVALMRPIIEVLNESEEVMMADKKADVEKSEEQQEMESRLAALETQTQELQTQLETSEAEKTDLAKQLEDAKAEIAKSSEEPEDIWKGVHPEIKKRFEAQQEQIEKAEAVAKQAQEEREKDECVKIAKSFDTLPINPGVNPDDDWEVFKDMRANMKKEHVDRIINILKSADDMGKQLDLQKEIGHEQRNEGDDKTAWGEIQKHANALVTAGVVKSKVEGIAKVTEEHPDLYKRYIEERGA